VFVAYTSAHACHRRMDSRTEKPEQWLKHAVYSNRRINRGGSGPGRNGCANTFHNELIHVYRGESRNVNGPNLFMIFLTNRKGDAWTSWLDPNQVISCPNWKGIYRACTTGWILPKSSTNSGIIMSLSPPFFRCALTVGVTQSHRSSRHGPGRAQRCQSLRKRDVA